MKKIPLNSLVISVNVPDEKLLQWFDKRDIISFEQIKDSLFGNQTRNDLDRVVMSELYRFINTKLTFGNRVVVKFNEGRDTTRANLARQIHENGYSVSYLASSKLRQSLHQSDNISSFIESDNPFKVIKQIGDTTFFKEIKDRGYNGITVIADIHGMYDTFVDAVALAKSRNNFILFLGDLIDYGIDSLEVAQEAYKLVTRGEAEMILGNHEMKIFRYLNSSYKDQSKFTISEGNKATLNRLNGLSPFDYTRWTNRFKSLVNLSRTHRIDGNFAFTHGAVGEEIWDNYSFRVPKKIESKMLYGETSGLIGEDGLPERTYEWVDNIPKDKIVVVGHDIRKTSEPLIQTNSKGGKVIFLDTGCGKGGQLTSLDITLEDKPKLGMFFVH